MVISGADASLSSAGSEPTGVRQRSRYAACNRGLAVIADAERNSVGAIDILSVIGMPHENGVTFDNITRQIFNYVVGEYQNSGDLRLIVENKSMILRRHLK